jgi:hypothetical protein
MQSSKITVVDDIMGSGKTSWVFQEMQKNPHKKYIYITPYLEEVNRCMQTIKEKTFFEPSDYCRTKLEDLKLLLSNGCDITTTHSLFSNFDNEVLELISKHKYTLVMDEVINVINKLDFKLADFNLLLSAGKIKVNQDKSVTFLDLDYNGAFKQFKYYCLNTKVYFINGFFIVWAFPIEIFTCFKETFILTYLFEGQIQKYYFNMHKLNYNTKSVTFSNGEYKLIEYINRDVKDFKNLINIYQGNLNDIGKPGRNGFDRLSKTKMIKLNKVQIKPIKNNITNYFINITKAKSSDIIWTTFLPLENKLKGKGYTKGFVPCNARATNEFGDRHNCAYVLNRYMNQAIKAYFISQNIDVDEDLYALSELLQWVWRSAIRNGEEINLYLPSERMRKLLVEWLR